MTLGAEIAAEVAAALGEASSETGDGELFATIIRPGAASGPDYNPTYTADIETPVNALIGSYSVAERAGGLIETTDIKLLVAAGQGVVPFDSDRVRLDGTVHEIKMVTPLKPGGVALMYELQVKS